MRPAEAIPGAHPGNFTLDQYEVDIARLERTSGSMLRFGLRAAGAAARIPTKVMPGSAHAERR
jgi:hypothetical protein